MLIVNFLFLVQSKCEDYIAQQGQTEDFDRSKFVPLALFNETVQKYDKRIDYLEKQIDDMKFLIHQLKEAQRPSPIVAVIHLFL